MDEFGSKNCTQIGNLTALIAQWHVSLLLIAEVYADPSYASYKALSFVSGVTTTFTPGVCFA